MIKNAVAIIILFFVIISAGCKKNYLDIMAVTGATPLALNESILPDVELKFEGMVKRDYVFSSDSLRALASTRVRVQEISPEGKFLGTYAYTGIPLSNLLEGIAPSPLNRKENSKIDRIKSSIDSKLSTDKGDYRFHPTDILVTFYSRNGKTSRFSYAELTFSDDRNPVLLAYHRKELKAGRDADKYDKNIYKDNIKGLRLVCPDDSDTSRYLDDVVKITYSTIPAPDSLLPVVKTFKEIKTGKKCFSETINCIDGARVFALNLNEYRIKKIDRWVRYSHGHGFENIYSAEGISFKEIIRKNFANINLNDFFLVAGCDGYRVLLSCREIFDTPDGESFLIIKKLGNGFPPGRLMFSVVKDFYSDRDVWGVTNIVRLKMPAVKLSR